MNIKRRRTAQPKTAQTLEVWRGTQWDPQWTQLARHTLTENSGFPWLWREGCFEHDFTAYTETTDSDPFAVIMGYLLEQLDPRTLHSVAVRALPLTATVSKPQRLAVDSTHTAAVYVPATRAARIVFPELGTSESFSEGKLMVFPANTQWQLEMMDTDTDQLVSWVTIVYTRH